MTRLGGRPLARIFPSWEKQVARIRFKSVKENQSLSLPGLAVGACQPTNHVLIRFKPFLLAVILLLGGLVGFPAPLKSDLKGPPAYSKQEIRRAVTVYAKLYRLDPALLRAVIKVESNFRQDAISRRGAVGLMQLMPQRRLDYRWLTSMIHFKISKEARSTYGISWISTMEICSWHSPRI